MRDVILLLSVLIMFVLMYIPVILLGRLTGANHREVKVRLKKPAVAAAKKKSTEKKERPERLNHRNDSQDRYRVVSSGSDRSRTTFPVNRGMRFGS